MTIEELRIGNLIHDGVIEREWDIMDFYECANYNANFKDFKPIPLTEEWLRKFGFKKMYNTELCNAYTIDCKLGEDDNNFYITSDKNVYYLGYDYDGSVDILNYHEIKSVHQLQNLYFALTGEELTIKE